MSLRGSQRKDFITTQRRAYRALDFDLKRSPVYESLEEKFVPLHEGGVSPVATFDTRPWKTVDEAIEARAVAKVIREKGCLRTRRDWMVFDAYMNGVGLARARTQTFVLFSLVGYWSRGEISCPLLDSDISVTEKVAWLSGLGYGNFSRDSFRHAQDPDRNKNLIPLVWLEEGIRVFAGSDILAKV